MYLDYRLWILGSIATLSLLPGCSESPDEKIQLPSQGQQPPRQAQTSNGEKMVREFADNMIKAKNGDAEAEKNIGNSYFFGEGIAKDYTEAAIWYRKAALKGNAEAQYNLAVLILKNTHDSDRYDTSRMLPMIEAYAFFILAASTDYKDARQKLAIFEYPEGKLNRADVALGQRHAKVLQNQISANKAGK